MDRSERLPILTNNTQPNNVSITQFCVTPYKICVSTLIHVFFEMEKSCKSKEMREIGHFCVIVINLIQSLDCTYQQLLQQISPPFISNKIRKRMIDKLNDITSKGLSELMEMISSLKLIINHSQTQTHSQPSVHKSSIVGLFLRRMWLYVDKLSFSAVSQLYEDLNDYIKNDSEINITKRNKEKYVKSDTCPQQMQYFISKQLNLIQINEKQAMTPYQLLQAIERNCDQTDITLASPNNEYNDIHFLKYLNSLRVNEFSAAKESLMAYFDGNSNQISRCWAALNLAILHSHFNHNELALQAIKECISTAQEANDEKCLEFALMWISRVLSRTNAKCDISLLLNRLQVKANELSLPYISSLAQLESEKLSTISNGVAVLSAASLSASPGILAVRHSMNDVLMMSYSSKAALFNLYGATNLATLTSQVLLHLNVVEPVGDTNVYHVNENTCIGVRNIALHLWRNEGQYTIARDMLHNLTNLYSFYKSDLNTICQQALAEIDFEHHLYECNWKEAEKCIAVIKSCNKTDANIRLAQMNAKQGDNYKAISIIDETIKTDDSLNNNNNPYLKVTTLLMKGKILNDITIVLECIDLCRQFRLIGLECKCLVQLSLILQQFGQLSQSQQILNSVMIRLLANGTLSDISQAYYIDAINNFLNYQNNSNATGVTGDHYLDNALRSNERAINACKLIGDRQSLKDGLKLQANIYHLKKDFSRRNYFARQVRLEDTYI